MTADPLRPPFRTTRVSYDPADFHPAPGGLFTSLSYGKGRFPVRTTNAMGHVEYSAYDGMQPFFGRRLAPTAFIPVSRMMTLGEKRPK